MRRSRLLLAHCSAATSASSNHNLAAQPLAAAAASLSVLSSSCRRSTSASRPSAAATVRLQEPCDAECNTAAVAARKCEGSPWHRVLIRAASCDEHHHGTVLFWRSLTERARDIELCETHPVVAHLLTVQDGAVARVPEHKRAHTATAQSCWRGLGRSQWAWHHLLSVLSLLPLSQLAPRRAHRRHRAAARARPRHGAVQLQVGGHAREAARADRCGINQ